MFMDEEVAANVPEAETELIIDNVADNEKLEKMLFGLAKWQYEQPHYTEDEPNTPEQSAQEYYPDDSDVPF